MSRSSALSIQNCNTRTALQNLYQVRRIKEAARQRNGAKDSAPRFPSRSPVHALNAKFPPTQSHIVMSRALTKNISTASRGIVSLTRSRCLSSPSPSLSVTSSSPSLLPIQYNVVHHGQKRHSSHSPLGAPPVNARKKVTLQTLQSMYKKNEPITMLTAYDFPSAHVADHAGMDIILVGDSLAMVSMGLEDTSEVTMDEMVFAARSVARATKSAFTVCLPCAPSVYYCTNSHAQGR
jgi:hypothetical protein